MPCRSGWPSGVRRRRPARSPPRSSPAFWPGRRRRRARRRRPARRGPAISDLDCASDTSQSSDVRSRRLLLLRESRPSAGAPVPVEPMNSFFPSGSVTSRPFARFDPSLARKPWTTTVVPASDGLPVPAAPEERVRRAALDHPADDLAVRALDVNVKPRVWIDPFHLGDGSLERHRLRAVELRCE